MSKTVFLFISKKVCFSKQDTIGINDKRIQWSSKLMKLWGNQVSLLTNSSGLGEAHLYDKVRREKKTVCGTLQTQKDFLPVYFAALCFM